MLEMKEESDLKTRINLFKLQKPTDTQYVFIKLLQDLVKNN